MSLLREYAAAQAQPTLAFGADTGPSVRFDEVVAPDGTLRAAWKGMAAAADLTALDLARVDAEIATLLADDGVGYEHSVRGSVPWRLDPLPLVMDAATWARLDVGLAQRAELLGALLGDLYGAQRTLAEGLIPAETIFAHAGFTRPLARASAAEAHPLILTGTDLGRDATGEWHVLADRVQAPAGLGYALENRRVLSSVLPELYQGAGLHRLEPYFGSVRAALLQAAPAGVTDPRIVVLTPGTYSETAFDQAFLANLLGFPLVQGEDLVVRGGAVWMKPAGFPSNAPHERVDVILRRVDADWCDPLELRAGSRLGVAGLTEAVRRGTVRLVNGLGAGVLENPGLMPFLPALCERLLGEQLRLPSVPTWWCGDPEGRDAVLAALDEDPDSVIVRTIDGRASEFDGTDPADLRRRILETPCRYVGQQRLPLSHAPGWAPDESGAIETAIGALPVTLRAFTVRDGGVYRALVGGLATHVGGDPTQAPVTKDVWVLKAAEDDPDQGVAAPSFLPVGRSAPMLSPRAVEDMYWAGRYSERAEDLVRLVLTARSYAEQLDFGSSRDGAATLSALIAALQRLCGHRHDDPTAELRSLLTDADRPGSAAHSLGHLREALEGVRDQLSGDTWRAFAVTDRAAASLRATPRARQIAESAGRMLTGILSLQGVTASMIRDDGWNAIEAGRYLERAVQLCVLLDATVTTTAARRGVDRAVMGGVLLAAESAVTHRRRYRGDLAEAGVLELLIADGENPRSLAFAFARVREHIGSLSASTGSTRPERMIEELEQTLATTDVVALARVEGERREELDRFLSETRAQLHQISEAIALLHFSAGPQPQALSALSTTELVGVGP